jgi:hypothetical protein
VAYFFGVGGSAEAPVGQLLMRQLCHRPPPFGYPGKREQRRKEGIVTKKGRQNFWFGIFDLRLRPKKSGTRKIFIAA